MTLISGGTETFQISLQNHLRQRVKSLTVDNQQNACWLWFISDSIIGNTLDKASHVIMLYLNRQTSFTVICVRYMDSVVKPWNDGIRNALRFTCYLKHCTECDVHCSRRKSDDFWFDYRLINYVLNLSSYILCFNSPCTSIELNCLTTLDPMVTSQM